MTPADDTRVTLREYLEAINTAHQEAHKALNESLNLARETVSAKLVDLNNLRQEVLIDRGLYLPRDVYEEKYEALKREIVTANQETQQLFERTTERFALRLDLLERFQARFVPLLTLTAALAALAGGLVIYLIEHLLGVH